LFKPLICLGAVMWMVLPAQAETPPADDATFFELRVRPVLAEKCLKCHGPAKASGGLRLDSRAAILKGGDRGPAAVAGDVGKSLLLQAIQQSEEADLRMPPGGKLSAATVADLTTWVKRGLPWPAGAPRAISAKDPTTQHWAFQPLSKPQAPSDSLGWAANPIDCFMEAKWRERGLAPVESASKTALLRRLTFDLTGLPPTPAEIDAYLSDESPDAYTRLVERLLASPQYGERWGRHWMDVVRYADTAGDNADYPVPEAALYRDYIIHAFNTDKPYSEFVCEQLAGDLLAKNGSPDDYAGRVVATTYLGLARRYLTAPYESWELTLEDVIDTTGRAFLGLTLRCARCHDHKFDPVTKEDYYAIYGIFASTQFPYAGSEEFASMKRPREHFVPLCPPAEARSRLEARSKSLQSLRAKLAKLEKESPAAQRVAALDVVIKSETDLLEGLLRQHAPFDDVKADLERKQSERKRWNNQLQQNLKGPRAELAAVERTNLPQNLPGAYAVSEGKIANVAVQIGGDPGRAGPVVPRGAPRFLTDAVPCIISPPASGRLEFARWLVDPRNPLTARVMVNRIWQHHFGRGLVATPSNFGLRGEAPSHPELLDWLAKRFIDSGWSIKAIQRLIVQSRTYRLAATATSANELRDPTNATYWHFERRRLDAEAIRDAMLAVSGNLDERRPEPQPFPPINAWAWTQHQPFKDAYSTNRRSVYLMTQRLQRHPFLALFDGPDTNASTAVRSASTVPLQALYLLNNPFVLEQAHGLASRLLCGSGDDSMKLAEAYRLILGRAPSGRELSQGIGYVHGYAERAAQLGIPLGRAMAECWASLAHVLLCTNEFLYVD
jgi:hypothetical protein